LLQPCAIGNRALRVFALQRAPRALEVERRGEHEGRTARPEAREVTEIRTQLFAPAIVKASAVNCEPRSVLKIVALKRACRSTRRKPLE
jgi:hypothetical protein